MKLIIIFGLFIVVYLFWKGHNFQKDTNIIALQPFEVFDLALVDTIKNSIQKNYGSEKVVVLDKKSLPKSSFINIKTPRYRADSLIRILRREKPDSIRLIMGLTDKDISTTKRDKMGLIKKPESKYTDWGIFGLGFRPGSSSVVSTFRLKTEDKALFIERLKKICIHEIGHNLGLKHCEDTERCVMRDAAETIKTIDLVNLNLCEICKSKILD